MAMPYYKVKVKSFGSGRELWIAMESGCLTQALNKAHQYCKYTRNLYFALEDFLEEITEEEYAQYMSKSAAK